MKNLIAVMGIAVCAMVVLIATSAEALEMKACKDNASLACATDMVTPTAESTPEVVATHYSTVQRRIAKEPMVARLFRPLRLFRAIRYGGVQRSSYGRFDGCKCCRV